ncbi:DUF421 domain-containing protein [Nafulsella turpanensis]|uniref:DUF421 domain-containing protein n=1 Tax=Nafulsella turpanensis TaxID=1265690 RepID=UPI00034AF827|nr:YetF domain-containing protein [Nafulsella turpanensis]
MDKIVIFWSGWEPIVRIVVVGTLTYIGIIILLRVSGKRTLASMNAFDFVITIAMGSAFGRILTAKKVSIAESLTTFLLLVALQYILSYIEVRSSSFSKLITSSPTLLFYNGSFLKKNMLKERIRKKDLIGAVRKKKFSSLNEVEAIILETDGSFSVIRKSGTGANSSYQNLLDKNA